MESTLNLMIPGPCAVEGTVLLEMASPMVAHYGPEWAAVYNETRELLKQVVGTRQNLFLAVGSGHLAVEAIIGNVLCPGEAAVVVNNGHFARRALEIASLYGVEAINIDFPWGQGADPDAVEQVLCKNKTKNTKAVILVHNETFTGVVNPVEIGRVVHEHGVLLVVDGVSSVGCMDFQMDRWQVDLCATASQKGLEAPPGLAVVAISHRAWEVIEKRKIPFAGWYMNLLLWRRYHEESYNIQPYGITMAVNNVNFSTLQADKVARSL